MVLRASSSNRTRNGTTAPPPPPMYELPWHLVLLLLLPLPLAERDVYILRCIHIYHRVARSIALPGSEQRTIVYVLSVNWLAGLRRDTSTSQLAGEYLTRAPEPDRAPVVVLMARERRRGIGQSGLTKIFLSCVLISDSASLAWRREHRWLDLRGGATPRSVSKL